MLSTSFTFRIIENNDDVVFTHMQMRERLSSLRLARMVDTMVCCAGTSRLHVGGDMRLFSLNSADMLRGVRRLLILSGCTGACAVSL